MPQVAYDFERFTPPVRKAAPQVRIAKRTRNVRRAQMLKMARTLVGVMLLVVMVCGLLYTNARITEIQSEITQKEKQLQEENSLYTYLNFEIENQKSLKEIEERAAELGMEKTDNAQVTYYRAGEGDDGISVKQSSVVRFFENMRSGFLNIVEFFKP